MIHTNLFETTEVHKIITTRGGFSVLEYMKDYSVKDGKEQKAYFSAKMNRHKKQVIIELSGRKGAIVQAGAMQITMGPVSIAVKAKSPLNILKQFVGSKVTGETWFKPHYTGKGVIVLEPRYEYILLEDVEEWNGSMVIQDGMFLACDDTVNLEVTEQKTVSAVLFGHEGFFNTALSGKGIVALESPVPHEELIIVDLEDDEIHIDGNMAIAWSKSLEFSVGMATGEPIGSAASQEGLVNIYRGTGRVMIAPVEKDYYDKSKRPQPAPAKEEKKEEKK